MDVRARILNYTIFGPAKFHYIPKNKFLKIENNFQKLKKKFKSHSVNANLPYVMRLALHLENQQSVVFA